MTSSASWPSRGFNSRTLQGCRSGTWPIRMAGMTRSFAGWPWSTATKPPAARTRALSGRRAIRTRCRGSSSTVEIGSSTSPAGCARRNAFVTSLDGDRSGWHGGSWRARQRSSADACLDPADLAHDHPPASPPNPVREPPPDQPDQRPLGPGSGNTHRPVVHRAIPGSTYRRYQRPGS